MPKLTPWFSALINPVRIGYYLTRNRGNEMVLFWDGRSWRASEHSPRHAGQSIFWRSREWCGLTRPATSLHDNEFALAA